MLNDAIIVSQYCKGGFAVENVHSINWLMSRKGPEVGIGMLDVVEDIFVGVKSH